MDKNCEYIIVQAGGKGTRLEHLTANKPKCLVPIYNKPMLFNLFDTFADRKFIIIGDYKYNVLSEYLKSFARVNYILVDARGLKGTCSGIGKALKYIPSGKGFMLIWSDLVIPKDFSIPDTDKCYVGLSGDFQCRWSCDGFKLEEKASVTNGVAGLFYFNDKSVIEDVPEQGEFVRYLSNKDFSFSTVTLKNAKEFGLLSEYQKLPVEKCRPFNKMEVVGDRIIKSGVNAQGIELGKIECDWYKKALEYNYKSIVKIYSFAPLTMERIDGRNIYDCDDYSSEQKDTILKSVVESLKQLHRCDSTDTDYFCIKDTYITKTFNRIDSVRNLIPFANDKYLNINGRKCINIFYCREWLDNWFASYTVDKFAFIHGDCTFSNMMIRQDNSVALIDPRGYFGSRQYFGDPAYDWAKVYYSLVGNYDKFNLKRFRLSFDNDNISVDIESNGWEDKEELFWSLIEDECNKQDIKLLHALIWISLTTYAWDNYDSICAAFYIGLYYFTEAFNGEL